MQAVALAVIVPLLQVPVIGPSADSRALAAWSALERSIVEQLLSQDLDAALASAPASDPKSLLRHLDLSVRAGRRKAAEAIIDRLATAGVEPALAEHAISFLFDHREFDLTARLIERVPGIGRGRASNLVGLWLTEKTKTPEEIDRWLQERGWTEDRVSLRAHLKTDAPLVSELMTKLRSQSCTRQTLDSAIALKLGASAPVDLTWVSEWCRPSSATESRDLGMLAMHGAPAVAVSLLQRALELPFTEADRSRLEMPLQIPPMRTFEEWERRFRAETRLALAEAYRATGDETRAEAAAAEVSDSDRQLFGRTARPGARGDNLPPAAPNPPQRPPAAPQPRAAGAAAPSKSDVEHSLWLQFASELRIGDWRSAERTWARLQAALIASDLHTSLAVLVPRSFIRLAEAAAQGGDLQDAVRFWRTAANLDRIESITRLSSLDDQKLRAALVALYEDMARRDPESWVPAAALGKLRGR